MAQSVLGQLSAGVQCLSLHPIALKATKSIPLTTLYLVQTEVLS